MGDDPKVRDPNDHSAATPMGNVHAEFWDFRAGILTKFGFTLGALGTVVLTGSILHLPPRFLFNEIELGYFLAILGVVFFAIGKFWKRKRLVFYEHGIMQRKWGSVDCILWRDIRQMDLERETSYGSGLAYKVRYHCSLQLGDGT
jgi:hypothetical protein